MATILTLTSLPEGSKVGDYIKATKTTQGLIQGEVYAILDVADNVVVHISSSGGGGGGGGDVEEAPIDGKQYARKDGDWEEVAAGGGGLDPSDIDTVSLSDSDSKVPSSKLMASIIDELPSGGLNISVVNVSSNITLDPAIHAGKWIRVSADALSTLTITIPVDLPLNTEFLFESSGLGSVIFESEMSTDTPPAPLVQLKYPSLSTPSISVQYRTAMIKVVANNSVVITGALDDA